MSMRKPTMADITSTIIAWEEQAKHSKGDNHNLFSEQFCLDTANAARDLLRFRLKHMPESKHPRILNINQLQIQLPKEQEELND